MDIRFSVGEIAEFYHISRQTVLFYDQQGVFKPKIIDPVNHYRYYTPDQLEELDTILMLKGLGLSLKEIREFMENRGSMEAVSMLNQQKERLEEKIQELTMAKKRVEKKAGILKDYLENSHETIRMSKRDEEYLIVEPVKKPYQLLQADLAIKRLMVKTADNPHMHTYQTGTMIEQKNLESGRFLTASYVFFPLARKLKREDCMVKPKGSYAIAYHAGAYETIGETYGKMLGWMKSHGLKLAGNSYEYCILDNLTSENPRDYITEIQLLTGDGAE